MKNNGGFAPIAIVLTIVAIVVVGGVASYFLSSKSSTPEQNSSELDSSGSVPKPEERMSASQLLGLWQKNENGFVGFLEFKENEFCANWSGGTPEQFVCGQYLPYQLDGNKMLVNGSPWAEWKIVSGKLEFKPKSQLDTDVYEKAVR
ncbi:MAG: hypothetical protein A3B96_00650 [Candidatus Spechtbacteria bacterium RIFCSPHIGHO2_02_FULL_43_15b]|uniref:Uncharacterized protein n=1 Tax=Candidatus Spechtbacteria bacterium RIFCSPHIGHO2_01_FULL_43_30 TaxID=1802158 RepID=A0A1G2H6U5_9BACT|nr:MAG: hypothetical protein A2827_01630 [Candidatus Spechtbacteria bacterium RIFCSPHIGHO2_01_FULL_43_30]OGZ59964.1 MAG: hypothetical protein A3B96_00650 [Candidatus Spechtbacteria bacterium RIFCSPHIGHO2_02_FULL_43_15b]